MAKSTRRSKRKVTGTKYRKERKKRKYERAGTPMLTKLGERAFKRVRTIGDNRKSKLMAADYVNLADPKTKKIMKVKIKTVVENKANRHYVRRNIITKGAIVDTEKGKARITSRPGQDGLMNAVLVK
ncbi:30S ribosomal protein S8e [Candidatus Woesearchaeota archaeon]|nr:30S ribosomal protein S8e [Candidatus Woesearchaeota archaeon]